MSLENLPRLNASELQPWLNKPEMLLQCAIQLKKDLEPYGIKVNIPIHDTIHYPTLFKELKIEISTLLASGGNLNDILYRVDVHEKWLDRVAESGYDLATGMTRLIVWRELQKVVTKFLLEQNSSHMEGDY